jgi:hypothetical protein
VICDSNWKIIKSKSTGTADNDWLWLVHEKIMSHEMIPDVSGTMIHVQYRPSDNCAIIATRREEIANNKTVERIM